MGMVNIDELEALEKAATPGAWVFSEHAQAICRDIGIKNPWPDAMLIMSVRNALPAMLAELRAARLVVDAVREHRGRWVVCSLHEAIDAYDAAVKGEK